MDDDDFSFMGIDEASYDYPVSKSRMHTDGRFRGLEITINVRSEKLVNRLNIIKAELGRLQKELHSLQRFGEDNYEDESVIRFDKRFRENYLDPERVWAFVAIKAKGYWYLSGPKMGGQKFTWDELVQWMNDGVDTIWLMTAEEEIVAPTGD